MVEREREREGERKRRKDGQVSLVWQEDQRRRRKGGGDVGRDQKKDLLHRRLKNREREREREKTKVAGKRKKKQPRLIREKPVTATRKGFDFSRVSGWLCYLAPHLH